MKTPSKSIAAPSISTTKPEAFIGIDFHKRYSVYHVIDSEGKDLAKGRIEHHSPHDFISLVKRWKHVRVVFEATMNWHWLFEILETALPATDIVLANPFKTRIIAEAQVKTDKIDARVLALVLRADLVSSVHIPCKATRQRKEVLRQRCFFVRQRTTLRNRIHRLLGAQHGLKLPQCSDIFGKKGMGFLNKLELPAPAGLLLRQQLGRGQVFSVASAASMPVATHTNELELVKRPQARGEGGGDAMRGAHTKARRHKGFRRFAKGVPCLGAFKLLTIGKWQKRVQPTSVMQTHGGGWAAMKALRARAPLWTGDWKPGNRPSLHGSGAGSRSRVCSW